MARTSKSVVASQPKGGAIATIDQELALDVANLRSQINAPSGNKIKVEVNGDFTLPDGMNLGNEIQVVVVDFVSRNTFYSSAYNPNAIAPPDCYAMGKDKADLKPESDSPSPQHDNCKTCPLNQFGSGTNGKSKACQNRYWLSVLLVDPDNPDAHNAPDAPLYILDLSPSNLRSFEGAIANTSRLMGHWVKAIYTVRGTNAGTYATITFVEPVPNPDYAQHVARRSESQDALFRRPDFAAAASAAPPRGGRRSAGARR